METNVPKLGDVKSEGIELQTSRMDVLSTMRIDVMTSTIRVGYTVTSDYRRRFDALLKTIAERDRVVWIRPN